MNRIQLALFAAGLGLSLLVWGCHTGKPRYKDVEVERARDDYENNIEQLKRAKIQRNIFIEAHDIQLPLASGTSEPANPHTYRFHVWAFHPDLFNKKPLAQVLTNELQIEVLGVPNASLRPLSYNEASQLPNFPILPSRSVVEITINSTNLDKSFEILAWFPNEYRAYEDRRTARLEALRLAVKQAEEGLTNRVPNRSTENQDAGRAKTSLHNPAQPGPNPRVAAVAAKELAKANQLREGRQRRIRESTLRLKELGNKLLDSAAQVRRLREQELAAQTAAQQAADAVSRAEAAYAAAKAGKNPSSAKAAFLAQERKEARNRRDKIAREAAALQAAREQAERERQDLQPKYIRAESDLIQAQQQLAQAETKVREAQQALAATKPSPIAAGPPAEAATAQPSAPKPDPGDAGIQNRLQTMYAEILAEKDKPNPWGQRVEIKVYHGDLRTQIQMVGLDEVEHNFGSQFAKYFFVGRIFLRNENSNKQLVVFTTSLRAKTLFYRSPDQKLAKLLEAEAAQGAEQQLARLRQRIEAILAYKPETATQLDKEQVRAIYNRAKSSPSGTPGEAIVQSALGAGNLSPSQFTEALRIAHFARERVQEATEAIAKRIQEFVRAKALTDKQATALRDAFNAEIQQSGNLLTVESIQNAFPNLDPQSVEDLFRIARDGAAQDEANWQIITDKFLVTSSPFDLSAPIQVNANNRPLAFSENSRRQAQLSSHGYAWQGYYRPMTFQSVLNSLVFVTESSPRSRVIRWMETAGIVAGGLIGLGPIFNEFTTRSYSAGVAVTTAILIPELRKLLLEDLQKYTKNLGDMAMDTVAVIQPSGVADRYVFFPRGPIFGESVDEFRMEAPSYIVQIDNNELAVQAILIEQGQTVQSGILSSQELVPTALDQGRAQRDADTSKLINMTENLRKFRLTTLPGEIDALIANGNTNGAVHLIQVFQGTFGLDTSGTIDKAIAKYGLPVGGLRGAAPAINPQTASLVLNLTLSTNRITVQTNTSASLTVLIEGSDPSNRFSLIHAPVVTNRFQVQFSDPDTETRKRTLSLTALNEPYTNSIHVIVKDQTGAARTNDFLLNITTNALPRAP